MERKRIIGKDREQFEEPDDGPNGKDDGDRRGKWIGETSSPPWENQTPPTKTLFWASIEMREDKDDELREDEVTLEEANGRRYPICPECGGGLYNPMRDYRVFACRVCEGRLLIIDALKELE